MRPIYGFMHVAQMNHWKEVIWEQAGKIMRHGLLAATKKIYVGVLGEVVDLSLPVEFMAKVEVIRLGPKFDLFEFPTLQKLYEVALAVDCDVWYVHTKGVSNLGNDQKDNWRRFMEYFVLEHWDYCRSFLPEKDVAGILWAFRDQRWIFAGNFWWATSEYVRKLPSVLSLNVQDRFSAEDWIGLAGPRVGVAEKYGGFDLTYWPDFRGLLPVVPPDCEWEFDEAYYLEQSPDVASAVAHGQYRSGREHFQVFGWREPRKVRFRRKDCVSLV